MEQLPSSFEKIDSKFKTQPKKHQLEYLNRYGREAANALFAEMGTGKTWMILLNAVQLWASGDLDALFVVAPNGVHLNWIREMKKHFPDYVRWVGVEWSPKTTKKNLARMERLYNGGDTTELRVFTMNWEALQTKKGSAAALRFCKTARSLMIAADESISMKNPKAERTKQMMKLKPLSNYRRIMDGHPVGNTPFDLFSQFSFLDESILGTTSFYSFKAEYADMLEEGNPLFDKVKENMSCGSRFNPQIVARGKDGKPRYKNLDKLRDLIAPHMYRVLKKDCLDLPPKVYKNVWFDLTSQQEEVYKKAKEECRLAFEGEDTPFNKLAAFSKLAQITSGYYIHPLSDEPVRIDGDNPKLDLLKERVESIIGQGSKVIIWARFRIEIEDIVNKLSDLGVQIVQYHGGVSSKDREQAIEDFENGDAQIFVGNQQAGGKGITLVQAEYVIYFSNNFSINDRLQSEDRAHRIGQVNTVTYINIAASGTIDQHVINILADKIELSDDIMGDAMDDAELAHTIGTALFS